MCGLSSYPVLHMLGCGSRIPWYTIELFCIYLVTWLIVVLEKTDMQTGLPCLRLAISNGVGAAFPGICVCVWHDGFPSLPWSHSLFSASVFCYKAASALYLLIIAVLCHSQRRKTEQADLLAAAAATCAFEHGIAFCRFMSRLSAVGFLEWGSFFMAAAIGYSLWRDVIEGMETA